MTNPQFDAIFGELAGRIARRELAPCTDYHPLEYDEFLRVFGAAEPAGSPASATAADLFGKNRPASAIPTLTLTPIIPQVLVKDPILLKVQRMIELIGMHVTDMDRSDKDWITVTSGALEMRRAPTTIDIARWRSCRRCGARARSLRLSTCATPMRRRIGKQPAGRSLRCGGTRCYAQPGEAR